MVFTGVLASVAHSVTQPVANTRQMVADSGLYPIMYYTACYNLILKIVIKKLENDLHVTKICRYFAPALMKETLLISKVLKTSFSRKNFQKHLEISRKQSTFAPASMKSKTSRKREFLRRFDQREKTSKKIWKFRENHLPLHPL